MRGMGRGTASDGLRGGGGAALRDRRGGWTATFRGDCQRGNRRGGGGGTAREGMRGGGGAALRDRRGGWTATFRGKCILH